MGYSIPFEEQFFPRIRFFVPRNDHEQAEYPRNSNGGPDDAFRMRHDIVAQSRDEERDGEGTEHDRGGENDRAPMGAKDDDDGDERYVKHDHETRCSFANGLIVAHTESCESANENTETDVQSAEQCQPMREEDIEHGPILSEIAASVDALRKTILFPIVGPLGGKPLQLFSRFVGAG